MNNALCFIFIGCDEMDSDIQQVKKGKLIYTLCKRKKEKKKKVKTGAVNLICRFRTKAL